MCPPYFGKYIQGKEERVGEVPSDFHVKPAVGVNIFKCQTEDKTCGTGCS